MSQSKAKTWVLNFSPTNYQGKKGNLKVSFQPKLCTLSTLNSGNLNYMKAKFSFIKYTKVNLQKNPKQTAFLWELSLDLTDFI